MKSEEEILKEIEHKWINNDFKQVYQLAKTGLKVSNNSPEFNIFAGLALAKRGSNNFGKYFNKIITLEPDNGIYRFWLGIACCLCNMKDRATLVFSVAVEKIIANPAITGNQLLTLARDLNQYKFYALAIDLINASRNRKVDPYYYCLLAGAIWENISGTSDSKFSSYALEAYTEALKFNPDCIFSHIGQLVFASLCQDSNKAALAKQFLDECEITTEDCINFKTIIIHEPSKLRSEYSNRIFSSVNLDKTA